MHFPADWPLPMRRVVRSAHRNLCLWEASSGEGAPLDMVARMGSRCLERMRDLLQDMYTDEIPESWWERWQHGHIGREAYLILCGEDPQPMRLNGAEHRYLRRVPTKSGNRKFRYIYDPKKAFPKTRKTGPRKEEKLLVPHEGQRGHYEVESTEEGRAIVQHDETGHRMDIESGKLYELFKDANDSAVLSEAEQKLLTKLEKEDRLPRARVDVFRAILDASGIGDYDFSKADAAYLAWKQGGKRGRKPPPTQEDLRELAKDKRRGGTGEQKPFSSLLEAFEGSLKGAKTWRDALPTLEKLRSIPGFENANFPDEVYARHSEQDRLLKEDISLDVSKYGKTLESDQEIEDDEPPFMDYQPEGDDWTDEILSDPFYEDPI